MHHSNNVYPIERIIAALTYITGGLAGFVWWIIAIILKKSVTPFLLYHIMQSIFLFFGYFLFVQLCKLLFIILYRIPLINAVPYYLNMPIDMFFSLSIVEIITKSVILYLAITAFMGMYSYIPWVSDIINKNFGRR